MLPVTNIQRFSTHDGPGIRTTVFLKGCPLACRWCHNPEAWNDAPGFYFDEGKCTGCGLCGDGCLTGAKEPSVRLMSVPQILDEVLKDVAFYGENGGITLSGGEPMIHTQTPQLIFAAKRKGLHVVVETCGFFDSKALEALRLADLVLWDIKDTDDARHLEYTGVSRRRIVKNLLEFDRLGGKTLLRSVMVRGVNLNEEHLAELAALRRKLANCQGVELLAMHPYGADKYRKLGMEWGGKVEWVPTVEEMEWAKKIIGC